MTQLSIGRKFGQLRLKGKFAAKGAGATFWAQAKVIEGTNDFSGAKGKLTWTSSTPGNFMGNYTGKLTLDP